MAMLPDIYNLLKSQASFYIPKNLRILVFGGALNSNSYRDKLIKFLKKDHRFITVIPDKINYFDISSEKYNLVEKETRLFENSDLLIIIPESAGSFAELGMIASMIHNDTKNKKKYAEKILIILNEHFKHDDSFLKLGPIKSIKHFGGNLIHADFQSDNFDKIFNKIDNSNINKMQTKIYLDKQKSDNISDLFFINTIKILIYIYFKKRLSFLENDYKKKFISELKNIHKGIEIDNIEYLESTELINKKNYDGKITIEVNYSQKFIQDLINSNFNFFIKHNIIYSFLKESGY
jgi:hypothetical protein